MEGALPFCSSPEVVLQLHHLMTEYSEVVLKELVEVGLSETYLFALNGLVSEDF